MLRILVSAGNLVLAGIALKVLHMAVEKALKDHHSRPLQQDISEVEDNVGTGFEEGSVPEVDTGFEEDIGPEQDTGQSVELHTAADPRTGVDFRMEAGCYTLFSVGSEL
jgi:hypothetical protein